mmetsp:Transcript_29524/g.57936  ORF Transcript_29524/g.57936 Transcript_29524/m.57936 type:complete len:572 (-) Transcript_29524:81-1796(-)
MAAVLPMDWFLSCCSCTRADICGTDAPTYDSFAPPPRLSSSATRHEPLQSLCAPPRTATRHAPLQNLCAPPRKESEVAPLLGVAKRSKGRIDRGLGFEDMLAVPPSQVAALGGSKIGAVEGFHKETPAAKADSLERCPSPEPVMALEANSSTQCLSPQLFPDMEADKNVGKSSPPAVEAEWGSGSVRVLIACAEKDTVAQLDHWCRRCGIVDVTKLDRLNSEELEPTIRALFGKCQPGDTCVLLLEASEDVDIVASQGALSLEALPLYTTVVSISDARAGPLFPDVSKAGASMPEQCQFKVGDSVLLSSDPTYVRASLACYGHGWESMMDNMLGGVFTVEEAKKPGSVGLPSPDASRGGVLYFPEEVLRKIGSTQVVQMLFGVEADVEEGFYPGGRRTTFGFCGAMLRAFEALSLADGPCSLSCSDFFAELGEQARDAAAASGLNLQTTLHERPVSGTAGHVRWPIAAKPREMARSAGGTSALQLSTSLTADVAVPKRAASQLPQQRPQPRGSRQPRRSSETRTSTRRKQLHQQQRGMPSNLGGLSKMLTGGALSEFPRVSSTPELPLLGT